MMRPAAILCLLALAVPSIAPSQTATRSAVATRWAIVPVTAGLVSPVGVVNAADSTNRFFIVQQGGRIRIWNGRQLLPTDFLNISSRISTGGERGLLGLAFHPSYETNGFFYLYYTRTDGDLTIARYQVSAGDPNVADFNSELVLLTIEHSLRSNHNGGQLAFGPDGYLYIGTGDGGGGGDPDENGQNITTLLGKLLRIDVNTAVPPQNYGIPASNPFCCESVPGADEIWAIGLRNPWRFGFDRVTGALYIADVGQGSWEEIDFQPAGVAGGQNYGWDILEGAHCFNDVPPNPPGSCEAFLNGGSVLPILEYDHSLGCSVTGGYVVRGLPTSFMTGNYIFGDYCTGVIWRGIPDGGGGWTAQILTDTPFNISSFGEDERGKHYLTHHSTTGSLQMLTAYTFADVPPTHNFWRFVEAISEAGITGGCSIDNYCPNNVVTRAQMAVFLLVAKEGSAYQPPPATGTVFADVPVDSFAAAWIEELARRGITAGCGNGNFCPNASVTRQQMAVFLLVTKFGTTYSPPPCDAIFTDVPCTSPFARWVEDIYNRGITAGCATTPPRYCPTDPVTRGQMSVFLTQTFELPTP